MKFNVKLVKKDQPLARGQFHVFLDDKPVPELDSCAYCKHRPTDEEITERQRCCTPFETPGNEDLCYPFCGPVCGCMELNDDALSIVGRYALEEG